MAAHIHVTRMETFSWHNLKLNSTVESGTKQTTVIFALLAPAKFTSVSWSISLMDVASTNHPNRHSSARISSRFQEMGELYCRKVYTSGLQPLSHSQWCYLAWSGSGIYVVQGIFTKTPFQIVFSWLNASPSQELLVLESDRHVDAWNLLDGVYRRLLEVYHFVAGELSRVYSLNYLYISK